jgi:hypothetical protein
MVFNPVAHPGTLWARILPDILAPTFLADALS